MLFTRDGAYLMEGNLVVLSRIELESQASEAYVLSIVLQNQITKTAGEYREIDGSI